MELVGGGSVIKEAYPVLFINCFIFIYKKKVKKKKNGGGFKQGFFVMKSEGVICEEYIFFMIRPVLIFFEY